MFLNMSILTNGNIELVLLYYYYYYYFSATFPTNSATVITLWMLSRLHSMQSVNQVAFFLYESFYSLPVLEICKCVVVLQGQTHLPCCHDHIHTLCATLHDIAFLVYL